MNKKDFCLLFVFLFFINAFTAFAKDNMAVLPFSGGQGEDGETIAELFMFDSTINGAFSLIPRTSITRAMRREQAFQMSGGMTDPDKAVSLGKELGAKYVIAGNIARLGNQNLLVIGIINTETLEQIAGEIQTFAKIEDMPAKLPAMARNIVAATGRDSSKLPKLATTRVAISGSDEAGDILAQILTIYLLQQGNYALYPRTKSLEQVQDEWDNQTSGNTADRNIVRIGAGENPQLALSCVARRLGAQTMFNASIINLESGVQDTGSSVNYASLSDGMEVMKKLADNLSMGSGMGLRINNEEDLKATMSRIKEMGDGDYSIIITASFFINAPIRIERSTNTTITITGDSQMRTITMNAYGNMFTVNAGTNLVLGNNLTLDGNKKRDHLIRVEKNGKLELQGDAIIQNTGSGYQGVYVYGTFTMKGGAISGNGDRGVYIPDGTFTMSGGTISGNSGRGVYISGGTFTMSGGTISGNSGGGVYISSGTFTMSGGTISGNTGSDGGGVSGTFTMSGGTITGNIASGSGGGVSGSLTMTGGTISENTAGNSGGGVSGNLTMSDGIISNNTAGNGGGGGVSGSIFTMNGGTISGNTGNDGGGVNASTFTMTGGTISGNTARNNGGGVYVRTGGKFTKNNGTITQNKAKNGQNVYVDASRSRDVKIRNSNVSTGDKLDTSASGKAGGWE